MSRSVIYSPNRVTEWVGVAGRLLEDRDWDPRYWIAAPYLREAVERRFSGAVFHTVANAQRSIPPDEFADVEVPPLEADTLESYGAYEPMALRMMDRLEMGNSFNHDERVRHYHRLLRYWRMVVDEIDLGLAVFANTPHTVARYVLYAVCVESGVDTLIFTPTKLPGSPPNLLFPRRRIHALPDALISAYRNGSTDGEISDASRRYLADLAGEDTPDEPLHAGGESASIDPVRRIARYVRVDRWPSYLRTLLAEQKATTRKRRGVVPEESTLRGYQNLLYKRRSTRYKHRLRDHYRSLSSKVVPEGPFVYLPLHYDPERATIPKGGRYNDQYLVAELLADAVPDDWIICVKEHPTQFSYAGRGEQGRATYDYNDLDSLDSVRLMSVDVPSVRLIDGARAVATVTGTAGWEAINRNTPAIVFGSAWYRLCGGVHHVRTRDDVRTAIDAIREGESIDSADVRRFVAALETVGDRIPMYKPETDLLESDETVGRYVRMITEFVDDSMDSKL